jgi:hypothetical protein
MRRFLLSLSLLLLIPTAQAQIAPETGPPEAAFAGGPIRLTPISVNLLTHAFPGGKVPIIPMPHRARLDAALLAGAPGPLDARLKELASAYGHGAVLIWERTRFLGTGRITIAAIHARDLAEHPEAAENVAMLWLYAVAATMTDGARCADPAARDAWIDRLRGPSYQPVLRVIRALPEAKLNTARETAIRLEAPLAEQRPDDTICGTGQGRPEIRPIDQWRPAAANTRAMLPRHLKAMTSVLRPPPPR